MECAECKRLWKAYSDATKRSNDLIVQKVKHFSLSSREDDFEVSKADEEWRVAMDALAEHISNHSKRGESTEKPLSGEQI